MTKDQQQSLSARAEAEKLLPSVFMKKTVKQLISRSSGFAAVFGKTSKNKRVERRLEKDRSYAQAVIEEWNNALALENHAADTQVLRKLRMNRCVWLMIKDKATLKLVKRLD